MEELRAPWFSSEISWPLVKFVYYRKTRFQCQRLFLNFVVFSENMNFIKPNRFKKQCTLKTRVDEIFDIKCKIMAFMCSILPKDKP